MQHKSLEKALQILLTFQTHNREIGTVELSNLLGIHRSTVSRIMKVLAGYEFLEQNSLTKKFSLGQANIRLASSLKQSLRSNLVQIAKPYVDDLRNTFQETTIIETLVGHNWVMAHAVESPGRIRLIAEIGERIPIHATSGGKAFLAFSSPELRESLLKGNLDRITKNTRIDLKELNRHFEGIRRQGFAFDKGEYDEGIHAIGAPIFNYQNKPIASIVVAGPSHKIIGSIKSPLVIALKESAKRISNRLGYKGS